MVLSCPNRDCDDYGKTEEGDIVANGNYFRKTDNKRVTRYLCRSCEKTFSGKKGDFGRNLNISLETIIKAYKIIANGDSIYKAARECNVKEITVKKWLLRALNNSNAINDPDSDVNLKYDDARKFWCCVLGYIDRGIIKFSNEAILTMLRNEIKKK